MLQCKMVCKCPSYTNAAKYYKATPWSPALAAMKCGVCGRRPGVNLKIIRKMYKDNPQGYLGKKTMSLVGELILGAKSA